MDWGTIVDDRTLKHIQEACGKKGNDAAEWVRQNSGSVTISWDAAIQEFREGELPKWVRRVATALPNCDQLSPDSFGVLVSLAYNRGCSFDLPGPRFAEMREIRHLMACRDFEKIPAQILQMQRLWRPNSGVWKRRSLEAALFERGLGK